MKELCKRFQNSIMFFLRFLLYGGCFLIFFALLGIENRQVRVLSRTSIMMAAFYLLVTIALTFVYGGFDDGRSNSKSVLQSMELTILITDLVTYLVFLIMSVNDANNRVFRFLSVGWCFLSIVLQTILNFLLVKGTELFRNYVTPPERTLVILSDRSDLNNVKRAIASFGRRYEITGEMLYDDPALHEKIKLSDAVFFYDVPAGVRTELVNYCYKHLINVYLNPDIADIVEMTSRQMMFSDVPFLAKEFKIMTFEQRVIKRLSDIILSAIALIIMSPVMGISAIAIKLNDGGPVFFRQKRATIHGRVFNILKFRTMRSDAGNHSAEKQDDRITKVGHTLRKYRIDELPQLINIIKGDMSLVGPRPEMLENVSAYERELPEFRYRLRMKAGLTGYAQIMGRYNSSSRDKLILDLMYIENFSLSLDIKILFRTVLVLLNADDSTEGF